MVSGWENGDLPTLHNMLNLIELFQCSMDELIYGKVYSSDKVGLAVEDPPVSYSENELMFLINRLKIDVEDLRLRLDELEKE